MVKPVHTVNPRPIRGSLSSYNDFVSICTGWFVYESDLIIATVFKYARDKKAELN